MNDPIPLLKIHDLLLQRGGVTVVSLPYLEVRAGETLVLIGPNGAGKSSLLLALAKLIPWQGGTLRFRGLTVADRNTLLDYRRRTAMVFQEPLLLDTTVYENVATGLKIRGMNKGESKILVQSWLERFGIAHLAGRHAAKLSGGEAQRTSLARAFAFRPEIVFLDEPFASLDPPTRDSLMDDLGNILSDTQTTAIMATHDRTEALRLADRMAVMKEGTIVQIASPGEVLQRPADGFVASFVGTETILPGTVIGKGSGTVVVDVAGAVVDAGWEFQAGDRVLCCIRPENVALSTTPLGRERTSARNIFSGTVEGITALGLLYRVNIRCPFPLCAYITSSSLTELFLQEGRPVWASVKATAVHLIRR